MALQEMEAADLLETIEHGVRRRRFGLVVRLVVTVGMRPSLRELLVENLEATAADVDVLDAPLALSSLGAIAAASDRPDLKFLHSYRKPSPRHCWQRK